MKIRLNYTCSLTPAIGSHGGIAPEELAEFCKEKIGVLGEIEEDRNTGKSDFMNLPHDLKTIEQVEKFAASNKGKWKNIVVIGIGGSALGCTALMTALAHPYHNAVRTPRVFVADNIDPYFTESLLGKGNPLEDIRKTLFLVITKSGNTAETIGTFAIALAHLKKALGKNYKKNVVAITDPGKGPLRALAAKEGFETFQVPPGVGGRFSVLTPVGLVPAALSGIDIRRLCSGAAEIDKRTRMVVSRVVDGQLKGKNFDPEKNIAFVYAALMHLLDTRRRKKINVFMPYSSRLRDVADWFRQLWAESLGKKFSTTGAILHAGQTPVKALGATDQHSQVQLYVEGPADKVVTFIRVSDYEAKGTMPLIKEEKSFSYLGGCTMAELFTSEALGTEVALRLVGRPSVAFEIDKVSPETVGGMMFVLELATAYAGKFYGINPFDQPGVEAGKIAAYALMGRPGFEKEAKEIRHSMKGIKTFYVE